jgi:hypothetical protein
MPLNASETVHSNRSDAVMPGRFLWPLGVITTLQMAENTIQCVFF